ncbi:MAG: hypothetical protein Q4A66_11060, partial [Eubacteriales bacterium]|nr:hypothetical protein [Eubacteriales bacterium]
MTGMELAREIVRLHPACCLIFCTSFTQYALDAIQLHVPGYLGYLIKPVTTEAIHREIELSGVACRTAPLLTARCFGNFEVYAQGQPLAFRRTRSKELLAYLIDRNGAGVTAKQICACLWDDGVSDAKNLNYLYQLFDDLRNTLSAVGAESVLLRQGYSYFVDPACISCDYYEYLAIGRPEFRGEYMTQYSWAEETCGLLWRK